MGQNALLTSGCAVVLEDGGHDPPYAWYKDKRCMKSNSGSETIR